MYAIVSFPACQCERQISGNGVEDGKTRSRPEAAVQYADLAASKASLRLTAPLEVLKYLDPCKWVLEEQS
jgi:hypothetical protein